MSTGSQRIAASVALVGVDGNTMGVIRETLTGEAVLPQASISFGDALPAVRRTRPDVVIVGFDQSLDAAIALAQTLVTENPKLVLLAVAKNADAEAIRSAMRVGFKEFIVLPGERDRLREVVHESAYSPMDDKDRGILATIVGAKGGVGCTLIASHLSAELAALHRVLCIDLDFAVGDLAPMLDLSPKDDVINLARSADRIDERVIAGSVTVHKTKLHVLAQPAQIEGVGETRPEDIYAILVGATKGYQYVLVDASTGVLNSQMEAISVSDLIFLVTTPDVLSVRNAFRRIKLLEASGGVDKERIRLIINRYHSNASVSREDIEANLGIPVAATIADDPRSAEAAINEGKLIREINRKSDCARDLASMMGLLTDDSGQAPMDDPEENKGFFSRLFG